MIIPSRWFSGGRGLDEFRAEMLADKHLRVLTDYESFKEVFPALTWQEALVTSYGIVTMR